MFWFWRNGYSNSTLLSQHSFPVVMRNLNDRSVAIQERTRAFGAQDISIAHMLDNCAIFLSIAQPAEALPIVQRVASLAKKGSKSRMVYVDLNAKLLTQVRELCEAVTGAGLQSIKGTVLGIAPMPVGDTWCRPIIRISGPPLSSVLHGPFVEELTELLRIRNVDNDLLETLSNQMLISKSSLPQFRRLCRVCKF